MPKAKPDAIPEDAAQQDAAPPAKITLAQRAFYEIGGSGVMRDLSAGDVVTDPGIVREIIALGVSYF